MGYIERKLAPGETIIYRRSLHWLVIVLNVLKFTAIGVILELLFFLFLLLVSFLKLRGTHIFDLDPNNFNDMQTYVVVSLPFVAFGLLFGALNYLASDFAVTNQRIFIQVGVLRRRFELDRHNPLAYEIRRPLLGRLLGFKTIAFVDARDAAQSFPFVDRDGLLQPKKLAKPEPAPPTTRPPLVTEPRNPMAVFDDIDAAGQTTERQLREAALLIQQGNRHEAQKIVKRLIDAAPRNADVWYLAGYLSSAPEKKKQAFIRALRINPDHKKAQQGLKLLQ